MKVVTLNQFSERQLSLPFLCFTLVIVLNLCPALVNSKINKKSKFVNKEVAVLGKINKDYKKAFLIDNKITKCSFGSHYNRGKCKLNSQYCLKYNVNLGKCLSCKWFTIVQTKYNSTIQNSTNNSETFCETAWPLVGFCQGLCFTVMFQAIWFALYHKTICSKQEIRNSSYDLQRIHINDGY